MNAERYDLIVLGSGSAARDGAGKAMREHGARVALIEHRLWGGSCPNVACRPTKAYVVAAELMHDVRKHAAERGIVLPEPTIELGQTRKWKDSLRRDQQSWAQVLKEAGYRVVPGTAAFVDAQSVSVGDQRLSGDRILIATGSRTAVPPIPGIEDIEWLDHVSALELEEVPESLLVVGAGPVGLEFAQIFARFGSRVTVVNSGPQIAARADAEAAGELQAALEEEGIEIVLNSGVDSFARGERRHRGVSRRADARGLARPARLGPPAERRGARARPHRPDCRPRRHPGRRPSAHQRRRRLGGRRRRGRPDAHPDRAVPGPHRSRGHVRRRLPACRLLGAPDRDLHGSRAGRCRADGGRGRASRATTSVSSSIRCRRSPARSTRVRNTASTRSSSTGRRDECSACTWSRARQATSSAASPLL